VRSLKPDILINNRVGNCRKGLEGLNKTDRVYAGDFGTPEQQIPASGLPGVDWESCMTMNDTWGFKSYDENWKSSERLARNLVDIVSKGGNYLLNVGPTPEGTIPAASVERLVAMGQWMRVNSESIYGTTASPFSMQLTWGRATRKGNTLYLHVFDWPADGSLKVPSLDAQPASASLLGGDSALKVESAADGFTIKRPSTPLNPIDSVVKVQLR
jgi:alpha-L-fucosidase